MEKSSVLNISHWQWFGTSTGDMSSDVQFCTSWNTSLNHMYKLMSHQHVEVEETLTVAEINQCSVSIKKSHGWNQTKFGNLYIPGTSGKKWVCERDERKKSKTKKEEQLEKNQCYRSLWSRRTTEDLGRLLKLTFLSWVLSSKEDSSWTGKWWRAILKGRPALWDVSSLRILTASLLISLSRASVRSPMHCTKQGLKCKLIKTKSLP